MLITWEKPLQGVSNANSRALLCTDGERGFMRALYEACVTGSLEVPTCAIKDGYIRVVTNTEEVGTFPQVADLNTIYASLFTQSISFDDVLFEKEQVSPTKWIIHAGLTVANAPYDLALGAHTLVMHQICWGDSVLAPNPDLQPEEWLMRDYSMVLPINGGPCLVTFGLDDFYTTEAQADARLAYLAALFETHYDEAAPGLKATEVGVTSKRVRKS